MITLVRNRSIPYTPSHTLGRLYTSEYSSLIHTALLFYTSYTAETCKLKLHIKVQTQALRFSNKYHCVTITIKTHAQLDVSVLT